MTSPPPASPQTQAQLEKWSQSLDELLKDPEGVVMFLKHLEHEHSSENLRFWLSCEKFKECPQDKLKEKAEAIFKDYLTRTSYYQVNLDSSITNLIKEQMTAPTPVMFEKAQRDIYQLMRRDSYPRFLKSDNFQQLNMDKQFAKDPQSVVSPNKRHPPVQARSSITSIISGIHGTKT